MGKATEVPPAEWLARNASAFAVAAPDPLCDHHVVVVPRREISSWLGTQGDEREDLWQLVRQMCDELAQTQACGVQVCFEEHPAHGSLEIHLVPSNHVGPLADADASPSASRSREGARVELVDARDGRFLQSELTRCLCDDGFDRIDLLVSFVMKSGLDLIGDHLDAAIERGARVRLLTTDYLHVTDADALARLLDLSEAAAASPGDLSVRLFSDPLTSFHPKAYLFHSSLDEKALAFVGSSNLSHSGIQAGVEWSLATNEVKPLVTAFDQLWTDPRTRQLTHDLLRAYRTAWRQTAGQVAQIGVETEAPVEPPSPRQVQAEALTALEQTRDSGFSAGMVVMATGLGKTWLAAFDSAAFGRTLFVAHREEILRQSRDVFRQVRPAAELGLYMGTEKQPNADVVFASVQTLVNHLDDFSRDEFDYMVIDEFHHAAAASYRKVIDHFTPRFLLGLTATPERMDGADLFALCGDNLVFDCGLVEGIDRGELVPFRYWGIKDAADYEGIPWRNGRFDPERLAERIETQQRAQQAFDEWEERCGERTLGFCASVSHAEFMARFFAERGVSCVAVHSQPGSAHRREALDRLRTGDVQVVFAVDMFNEGIDVPEIDSVLMLRPTESPVVFLQQLGRGLRLSVAKDHLRVVDFVGNHRSFLSHPRVLLGMTDGEEPSNARVLRAVETGEWDLPAGCSITFDVEAIDLIRLLTERGMAVGDALEQFVAEFSDEHERRPTAAQASAAGYNPAAAKRRHGGWFGLLDDLNVLEPVESTVWRRHRQIFEQLERESITRSYKLVTLKALLAEGALRSGIAVDRLAARSQHTVVSDPRLVRDTTGKAMPSPATADPRLWEAFWRKWPLDHLTGGPDGHALFRYDNDRFAPTFSVPAEHGEAFDAMVAEIVEWRLADYLLRSSTADDGAVRCTVSHSSGSPIVRFDRARHPELPMGVVPFTADGRTYEGRFMKIALNVAHLRDEERNVLPDLMRGWFGPNAGHPGTRHQVVLQRGGEGWTMAPVRPAAADGLSKFIGERFRRQDVPPLFGLDFNPGNWNSGHVSLNDQNAVVLFVTLTKSDQMSHGSDYEDYFESPDVFVWSSQTSTGPDTKKGREILDAPSNGTAIHLFIREKKTDVAFDYRGILVPIDHRGSQPMSVRFRLVGG